ncbi:DUF2589 domain-containing protein [Myroides sp. C15-4]|uniref:DUF2589 domain-containing protein n=1 Tax=Myroides sp. C15-4 TaxID=3400532 RepID=UPI003D2F7E23
MTTISLKKFIKAIHLAILHANDQLSEKNLRLLDHYFEEKEVELITIQGEKVCKKAKVPKTVLLSYPEKAHKNLEKQETSLVSMNPIEVPLIALIPLETCSIQKATFSLDFNMEVDQEELRLYFGKSNTNLFQKKTRINKGKLKVTLRPHPPTEGLKRISEGYENYVKRQVN